MLKDVLKHIKVQDIGLHFRTGVSYMLPFLLIGGLLGSIGTITQNGSENPVLEMCRQLGEIGLSYFIVIMAGYIAYSIADNAGIAPGLIVGFLARENNTGYLGAILGGFLVGYATKWLLKVKIPEIVRSTWGMLVPAVAAFCVSALFVLVLADPLVSLMESIKEGLFSLKESGGNTALGAVMGALGGSDFGGPFSKTQSTFATAVMEMKLYTPLGICGAIVTVPPLGMCLAAILAPRLYTESELGYARKSWVYALLGGFTEIVIPLAMGDILRVTIATISGCVVTGVIAGYFSLQLTAPALGAPQWFFYDQPLVYWGGLIAGILTVVAVVNSLKLLKFKNKKKNPEESDENSGSN